MLYGKEKWCLYVYVRATLVERRPHLMTISGESYPELLCNLFFSMGETLSPLHSYFQRYRHDRNSTYYRQERQQQKTLFHSSKPMLEKIDSKSDECQLISFLDSTCVMNYRHLRSFIIQHHNSHHYIL